MLSILAEPGLWVGSLIAIVFVFAVGAVRRAPPWRVALSALGAVAFVAGIQWAVGLGTEALLAAGLASLGMATWGETLVRLLETPHRRDVAPAAVSPADSSTATRPSRRHSSGTPRKSEVATARVGREPVARRATAARAKPVRRPRPVARAEPPARTKALARVKPVDRAVADDAAKPAGRSKPSRRANPVRAVKPLAGAKRVSADPEQVSAEHEGRRRLRVRTMGGP